MGFLHDIFFEAKAAQFETDLKAAYGMGFRDGRLCPADLRPCTVDGQTALFHRFVEDDRGILKVNAFMRKEDVDELNKIFHETNVVSNCCTLEKLRSTMALIEWPDGRLSTVAVERVQFTDREDEK